MKKISGVAAVLLCLVTVLSLLGCGGCNGDPKIIGSANWLSRDSGPNFREEAHYTVNYTPDFKLNVDNNFNYDFSVNEDVDSSTFTYGVGSYTTVLQRITAQELPAEVRDYVLAKNRGSYELYRLTGTFVMPVAYDLGDKHYEFDDTIDSEVYFDAMTYGLQPYYSKKSYDNTFIANGKITRYAYTTETVWQGRASVRRTDDSEKKDKLYDNDEHYELRKVEEYSIDVKYSEGAALDNEQLLFAVRAFSLAEDYSTTVKVLDTAYRSLQPVSIAVRRVFNVVDPWTLKLAASEKNYTTTSTYVTAIERGDATYSGSARLCYYQVINYSGDEADVEVDPSGRGWLIKMVHDLGNGLGAIEYRLTDITVND